MKNIRPLKNSFFNRDTVTVAQELLGKYLVKYIDGTNISGMITEVEVYDGLDDLASHASRGETPRTRVMYGVAGHWYVYLCYGIHSMVNIVTREQGYPGAILIRGTDVVSGPGRLTKYFRIDSNLNTKIANKKTGLWIEDRGVVIDEKDIQISPRIGVDSAGPEWAGKHLRFFI